MMWCLWSSWRTWVPFGTSRRGVVVDLAFRGTLGGEGVEALQNACLGARIYVPFIVPAFFEDALVCLLLAVVC